MKKQLSVLTAIAAAAAFAVTGCGASGKTETAAAQTSEAKPSLAGETSKEAAEAGSSSSEQTAENASQSSDAVSDKTEGTTVRIGSLKGPTSMGLLI